MQTVTENQELSVGMPSKKRRSISVKIGVGLLGAVFYLTMVFAPPNGLPFAAAVAIFSMLGAAELYRAVQKQGGEPTEGLGYFACFMFQFAAWTHGGTGFASYLPAVLILLMIATLLAELVKRRSHPLVNVGTTLLGAVYVGWLISYLTLLRSTNLAVLTPPIRGTTTAEWLVVFVTGVAPGFPTRGPCLPGCSSDVASWLRPSARPRPGRALSADWFYRSHSAHPSPIGYTSTYATRWCWPCCAACSARWESVKSALKRDLGVKDFGTSIPGHGGVLDRVSTAPCSLPPRLPTTTWCSWSPRCRHTCRYTIFEAMGRIRCADLTHA